MNWDEVQGNWLKFKGEIKERWGRFTDDELDVINGRREQLSGEIQRKYGITKEKAEREIDEFLEKEREPARF